MTIAPETTRLDELDKNEWRSVYFSFKPDASEEEYDAAWAEFQNLKERRKMQ